MSLPTWLGRPLTILLAIGIVQPVCAAAGPFAAAPFATPVASALLEQVRGGFSVGDGPVTFAFSVRQSVELNGSPVASTGLQALQDGGPLAGEASKAVLVQLGGGNTAALGPAASAAGSIIIQNSLANQQIRTVTTLDIAATVLGTYRNLNLQSVLSGAIAGSLRH